MYLLDSLWKITRLEAGMTKLVRINTTTLE